VIGDVITHGLCEALGALRVLNDNLPKVQFIILGAALPKVVGRLASLRLDPKSIQVAWLCPLPLPSWISERADEFLLIPPQHLREESEAGGSWDEECLIRGWRTQPPTEEGNSKLLLVQQLVLREWNQVNLKVLHWAAAEFAQSILPREVIAAAGQVENLARGTYASRPSRGEEWRKPPPGFDGVKYHATGYQRAFDGWRIEWASEK